jgi:serine/threonine protein phosphatase PrpC
MREFAGDPRVRIGFVSETGLRRVNEDFVGAVVGGTGTDERRDVVVAVADGIGGARGGRIAAETAVRGFLDGFWEIPETIEVRWAAARILEALNRWLHAQGSQDQNLKGMGCTFTALILRGRSAHVVHVGDSRAYRLSGDHLTRLTEDHLREGPNGVQLLHRAMGIEPELRLDYAEQPLAAYDRFMLCSDGVHAVLTDERIGDILRARSAPSEASRLLVESAFANGGADNCSALVLDVVGLPAVQSADLDTAIMRLPLIAMPRLGATVDGFLLKVLISEGPYSRLFAARDQMEGGVVVLKFPNPAVASVEAHHAAFVREAWVGARISNPWVGKVLQLAPGRQTCLYTVMPLYRGELLQTRLARRPAIGLEEGRSMGVKLAHAAAALHRVGVIHRDIKPDNVILEEEGAIKLIDLGVVRVPGLEEAPPTEIPGAAAYMAPEMFEGEPGDVATDIFALGVTLFRAFTGEFPYGNTDATSRARLKRPKDLSELRPDLPAWVGAVIGRALAVSPSERFDDATELAEELEAGPAGVAAVDREPPTFYERHRLRFWQAAATLLGLGLLVSLWLR